MNESLKLAAFADEISSDLEEQIRICRRCGITHFELRGVRGVNVMNFDPDLRQEVRSRLRDAGLGVACIASPLGKVRIDEPWQPHFDRFKRGVDLAEYFGAPFLRVFSYYPPEGAPDIAPHRDEVMQRMRQKAEYLVGHPVTLVHENEKDIYGARAPGFADMMRTVDSPHFRAAFDFANFVQVAQDPWQAWQLLKPYVVHFHIKDVRAADGALVIAGRGDGQIQRILADAWRSGYRGFLTLEPHLLEGGQFGGFTGPDLFVEATAALRALCAEAGIEIMPA